MTDHPITNPKIAGLEPTWRTWRGVSVLFDNPGRSPGRRLEDATVAGTPQQRLYDDLAVLMDAARPATLRSAYGFCPLPRATYHVTVCDGPNEMELARAATPGAEVIAPVLAALPDSVAEVPRALAPADAGTLLRTVERNPVTLTAAALVIWGSVLAARLVAADEASSLALEQITVARSAVTGALHTMLGVPVRPWRPHVSLGYFASDEGAGHAQERLAEWNQWLAAAEPASITYRSAALYAFTDMVSFFRAGT